MSTSACSNILKSEPVIGDRDAREMRHLFVVLVGVLIAVGIQMVHSASLSTMPGRTNTTILQRHLCYVAVSAVIAWLASGVSSRWLQRVALPAFVVLTVMLIAVLVPGMGTRVNGSARWLRVGSLSVQPSEFGRLILPLLATMTLIRLRDAGRMNWRAAPEALLPLAIVIPLVISEPDLGATAFLTIGYILPFFLGGWPLRYFLCAGMLLVPAVGGMFLLRPYQVQRVAGFVAAWQDLNAAPWQIRQSLLSLGSGGLQGKGIGAGWQKLSYLPEANTDFVFAVIGEELGLAGTFTVCVLWIGVFLTGRAALKTLPRGSFGWILGTTLHTQIVLQALANIAVVTAMVPPKGVPHPFISYGGTNLLVNTVAVGLVAGSAAARPDLRRSNPDPAAS
jgi:cell division protein FtsW